MAYVLCMHRQPVAERPPRQSAPSAAQHTVLDVTAFEAECHKRGLDTNVKIAERLGLSHTTVGRARSGRPVGAKFIAAVRIHLSIPYERVFKQNGAA